jgi:hypothetical protein
VAPYIIFRTDIYSAYILMIIFIVPNRRIFKIQREGGAPKSRTNDEGTLVMALVENYDPYIDTINDILGLNQSSTASASASASLASRMAAVSLSDMDRSSRAEAPPSQINAIQVEPWRPSSQKGGKEGLGDDVNRSGGQGATTEAVDTVAAKKAAVRRNRGVIRTEEGRGGPCVYLETEGGGERAYVHRDSFSRWPIGPFNGDVVSYKLRNQTSDKRYQQVEPRLESVGPQLPVDLVLGRLLDIIKEKDNADLSFLCAFCYDYAACAFKVGNLGFG